MLFIQIIIGAILNRWRGSGKDPKVFWLNKFIKSKTPKIIIMAIAYGFFIYLKHDWIKASLCCAWFGGLFTIGWGLAFAMGNGGLIDKERAKKWYYRWWIYYFGDDDSRWTKEMRVFRDYDFMVMRGLWITCVPGLILCSPLVAISGAMMGPLYWLGWKVGQKIKHDPIAICEYLYGGFVFACAYIT